MWKLMAYQEKYIINKPLIVGSKKGWNVVERGGGDTFRA
jgi:hypothetical protein